MSGKDKSDVIPFSFIKQKHKLPKFVEKTNKDWVYFGEDNLFPNLLVELFSTSSKHNAIVTGKTNYIFGGGWAVREGGSVSDQAKVDNFIKNVNPRENFNDLSQKLIMDYELFGGVAMEVVWAKSGEKIAEINHVDFSKVRKAKEGGGFFTSDDWSKQNQTFEKTKFLEWEGFNPKNKKGRQLYYYKQYRPGLNHYPLPEYVGALPYIQMDGEIANFHLNNIRNGFWGSFLINIFGQPTDEAKEEIEDLFEEKFTGSDNAGRFILNFAASKERAAELLSLTPPNLDNMFMELNKQVRQEMFSGHKITSPSLFGVETDTPFGGRVDTAEKYQIFQNTYVSGKQKVHEEIWNELVVYFGLNVSLELIKVEPISEGWSEGVRAGVMSAEEIRSDLGLDNKEGSTFGLQWSEKGVADLFRNIGIEKKGVKIIKSREVGMGEDVYSTEATFRQNFLEGKVSSLDLSILELLNNDPLMSVDAIATALKTTPETVNRSLSRLVSKGLVSVSEKKEDKPIERKVLGEGKRVLKKAPKKEEQVEVRYSYEARPGLQEVIDNTRPFCRALLSLNKLYTRTEIEQLNATVGHSVWDRRGGFWTKKGTNITSAACRHVWQQHIVVL